jgi:hypothetical protein
MSLLTQFRGDIKSAKTLSGIYWTKRLAGALSIPVFTNMTSLAYPNDSPNARPWAETVVLDDLMLDMMVKDVADAYYKKAVLFIDEAHVWMATDMMRNARGQALIALIAQAGKRGMIIVMTSHLKGMLAPKVRELIQLQIKCKTLDEGHSVQWNVRDPRDWREADDEGQRPPPDHWMILHNGHRQFNWYDTNEIVNPFSGSSGVGATKGGKALFKELTTLQASRLDEEHRERERTVKGITDSQRHEISEAAGQTRREILSDAERNKRKVFGGRR